MLAQTRRGAKPRDDEGPPETAADLFHLFRLLRIVLLAPDRIVEEAYHVDHVIAEGFADDDIRSYVEVVPKVEAAMDALRLAFSDA